MAKHSIPGLSSGVPCSKRRNPTTNGSEPPIKKARRLLTDESSNSSDDGSFGGAPLQSGEVSNTLPVNEDFARRFEHNKRREELQKLEEKHGKRPANSKPKSSISDAEGATDTSSDSEEEDDDGVLASGDLDQQFQATLTAIRARDPRVYDKRTTFYTTTEDHNDHKGDDGRTRDKPMYLSDYHRKNLLEAVTGVDENEGMPTYAQEQNDMKANIIREIHARANDTEPGGELKTDSEDSEAEAEEDFLILKASKGVGLHQRPQVEAHTSTPDVDSAEKDPEKFLSDFMTSRAWVSHMGAKLQPFQSDDEEEEQRADEFEAAYNLRFEDPGASNEKLVSHARDATARYSVRREALTGRKKARELERAKRDAERQDREEEKARLRKLRVADAEEKVKKIKDAAGLKTEHLNLKEWSKFLEEGWDDKRWDEEMRKSFGDTYYEDQDFDENGQAPAEPTTKIKKPRWEDDIGIEDLVLDFEEQQSKEPEFRLSDIESDDNSGRKSESNDEDTIGHGPVGEASDMKHRLREQKEHQKHARRQRRQIEQLVDQSINADNKLADMGPKHMSIFRYRETSPVAYGLTAQDILMASDSQLNQYAGLKKLATFRDSTKKAKDHKQLGKKARLRQWRKETFGNEQGPQQKLAEILASQGLEGSKPASKGAGNAVEGTRRKKRSKTKATTVRS